MKTEGNKVPKWNITKIIICELMGFVEIIRAIKTKNVSLLKISILVQIDHEGEILLQLYSNESKMPWFIMLGTKSI